MICWLCDFKFDPDKQRMFKGEYCPNCGISQNTNRKIDYVETPKMKSLMEKHRTEKPRFFNVRITGIATNNDTEE